MTRIVGHLCVRNEANRYLREVLEWHSGFLDDIHVFDDQSTDDTVAIAGSYAFVETRLGGVGFMENESSFRELGWRSLSRTMDLRDGDWVLCLDADEFFVAKSATEDAALRWAVRDMAETGVELRIDEVFDVRGGVPQKRTDGFWGDICGLRLVRWQEGGRFAQKGLGGGSVPTYAHNSIWDATNEDFSILHYGYARPEDRQAKYDRYNGRPGHSNSHIQSILTTPALEPVDLERNLP